MMVTRIYFLQIYFPHTPSTPLIFPCTMSYFSYLSLRSASIDRRPVYATFRGIALFPFLFKQAWVPTISLLLIQLFFILYFFESLYLKILLINTSHFHKITFHSYTHTYMHTYIHLVFSNVDILSLLTLVLYMYFFLIF